MLKELPRNCSIGVKTNSKGHQYYWRGYKLHLDVADGQIPISAVLTGASVHDSQVAIPLATMSSSRVQYCYELMDRPTMPARFWNTAAEWGTCRLWIRKT